MPSSPFAAARQAPVLLAHERPTLVRTLVVVGTCVPELGSLLYFAISDLRIVQS